MKIVKKGGHRLFQQNKETATVVCDMLRDLEQDGMDAVRKYSKKFDDWNPQDFELNKQEIAQAISQLDEQAITDTDYCQDNVRRFAQQ